MATITIQVNTGVGTVTRTKTVTGAHLLRLIAVYKVLLNLPSATDDQVLTAWADYVFADVRLRVLEAEQSTARQTANSGIAEIAMT